MINLDDLPDGVGADIEGSIKGCGNGTFPCGIEGSHCQ